MFVIKNTLMLIEKTSAPKLGKGEHYMKKGVKCLSCALT